MEVLLGNRKKNVVRSHMIDPFVLIKSLLINWGAHPTQLSSLFLVGGFSVLFLFVFALPQENCDLCLFYIHHIGIISRKEKWDYPLQSCSAGSLPRRRCAF